jgi:carbon-monoxide dehydrogenase iron sulfur subunit
MPYKVVVDLDALRRNPDCAADCSYPYRKPFSAAGDAAAGSAWLKQYAAFEVFCRRCDDHPCVNACRFDALEQLEDGRIKRWNFRCTQCNSCMVACPFGTIIPTALVFRDTMCDLCVGRDDPAPLCCQTCECGAFTWQDISDEDAEDDPGLFVLGERLAVRTKAFTKVEAPLTRKTER